MGYCRRLLIIGLWLFGSGLAGCSSEVEFSEAPFPTDDKSETRPARTMIFAGFPVDLTEFQIEVDRVLPSRLLTTKTWLQRAACYERQGRKRCSAARVKGLISRDGAMKLMPHPTGITAVVPLKAEFSARGQGRAKDVGDSVSQHFSMYIPFNVSLNEAWLAKVSLGKISLSKNSADIKLLGRPIKYIAVLERKISRQVRYVSPKLEAALKGQSFQKLASKSWRRLFNPIQISSNPKIWLRGRPMAVGFGGFGLDGEKLTARIAITTLLSTHVDERPVPLMPMALPGLTRAQIGADNSHINIGLPVRYSEFDASIKQAVVKDEVNIGDEDNEIMVRASSAELYASRRFLALRLNVETDIDDEWFDQEGALYLTALPWFDAEKGLLTLNHVGLTQPKTNPKFFLDGNFLFKKVPFTKWFKEAMRLDLNDRFEKVLADMNDMVNMKVGKSLWLSGRFTQIGVTSISPRADHLQLNLKLRGTLNLSQLAPVDVELLPTKVSAAEGLGNH